MGKHCDSRCLFAVRDICTCSCAGANHGMGRSTEPKIVIAPAPIDTEKLAESHTIATNILTKFLNKVGEL